MSTLVRASTLVGNPVVTFAGESPVEIKDVVFAQPSGRLVGFTLRKHGFLGGPVDETLSWEDVHGLGPDAVIVQDASRISTSEMETSGDITADQVMTENGTQLGRVVEILVATGPDAEVVGFEIEPHPSRQAGDARNVFIPLPDTLAVSDEMIVVPDSATDYIRDDLTGFGSAVDDFRSQLSKENS